MAQVVLVRNVENEVFSIPAPDLCRNLFSVWEAMQAQAYNAIGGDITGQALAWNQFEGNHSGFGVRSVFVLLIARITLHIRNNAQAIWQ